MVQTAVKPIQNEAVINKPFSQVWDELVKGLAKSFYVINNIEKASRLINVSFSTESPQSYVNCGKSIRTYERDNERANYEYEIAASSTYKLAAGRVGQYGQYIGTLHVHRSTSLEGRVNVYVAPQKEDT